MVYLILALNPEKASGLCLPLIMARPAKSTLSLDGPFSPVAKALLFCTAFGGFAMPASEANGFGGDCTDEVTGMVTERCGTCGWLGCCVAKSWTTV